MDSLTDHNSYRHNEPEFNLRERNRRAHLTREDPSSRRFSASYIRSFREDIRSSRTNLTISSTASSPDYSLKEEIDPSTYSFTSALKALQARTVYNNWDWLTPEGFALNSKWNDAEKYICNPLSGDVPMECLSAKTLSGRSFRINNFTMSAPLIYPSHHHHHPPTITHNNPKPTFNIIKVVHEDHNADPPSPPVPLPENKVAGFKKDVGVQSTPADLSSSSPRPTATPPITERSLKRQEVADDSSAEFVFKLKAQDEKSKIEEKEKEENKYEMREKGTEEGGEEEEEEEAEAAEEEQKKVKVKKRSGCLYMVEDKAKEQTQTNKIQQRFAHLCSSSKRLLNFNFLKIHIFKKYLNLKKKIMSF